MPCASPSEPVDALPAAVEEQHALGAGAGCRGELCHDPAAPRLRLFQLLLREAGAAGETYIGPFSLYFQQQLRVKQPLLNLSAFPLLSPPE